MVGTSPDAFASGDFAHPTKRRCIARHARGQYRFFAIWKIMRWVVETLNATVDAEIESLPVDMRARLARFSGIIEEVGFEALARDSVKHLDDRLWELRITGRDGISRAIYVTAQGRRVVILRAFIKKTQKTPPR